MTYMVMDSPKAGGIVSARKHSPHFSGSNTRVGSLGFPSPQAILASWFHARS